jgi:hypothetical protein
MPGVNILKQKDQKTTKSPKKASPDAGVNILRNTIKKKGHRLGFA